MVRIAEAIVHKGMLKFDKPLQLTENTRVRVTVEELVPSNDGSREEALQRLLKSLETPFLRTGGKAPSRDELYDRD